MRAITYIMIALFIMFFSQYLVARDFQLVTVEYESMAKSPVLNSDNALQDSRELGISALNFNINLPILLSGGKTIFLNSVSCKRVNTHYSEQNGLGLRNSYIIGYQLTWLQNFSNQWQGFVAMNPRLASDLDQKITLNDWTFNSAFAVIRKFSDDIKFGLGAYYIHSFGHPLVFPLINFYWVMNTKFRTEVMFPDQISLWYTPSDNLEIGLVNRYIADQFHAVDISQSNDLYYRYLDGILVVQVNYKLLDNILLFANVGWTLSNQHEVLDCNGNFFPDNLELNYKNNIYIKTGISYTISTRDK